MKTNTYNKAEHMEGYVGSGENHEPKSNVQKEYERGNEGNEVPTYGKESLPDAIIGNPDARDGFDNTGTQGKDSLSDDSYNSLDVQPTLKSAESKTGSSTDDFSRQPKPDQHQTGEDEILNEGI